MSGDIERRLAKLEEAVSPDEPLRVTRDLFLETLEGLGVSRADIIAHLTDDGDVAAQTRTLFTALLHRMAGCPLWSEEAAHDR